MVDNRLFVFGGYDGRQNHNALWILDCDTWTWSQPHVSGTPPAGRNGHSATLVRSRAPSPGAKGGERRLLVFVGGWLGVGPLAATDLCLLDVDELAWVVPAAAAGGGGLGAPGPCNMHTADWVPGA